MTGWQGDKVMLARALYWMSLLAAISLFLLVLGAPSLDNGTEGLRLLALFARDAAVRRTAIAGAIGLVVTACFFFRQPAAARTMPRKPAAVLPPRPPVIGA